LQLYPLLYTVQTSALNYFRFTTSHDLRLGSKLEMSLPEGLMLPESGTEIEVIGLMTESSRPQESTKSFTAVIADGQKVVIENFLSKKDAPAPYEFWFILTGIGNQLSCKDAGSWLITTYDYDAETK